MAAYTNVMGAAARLSGRLLDKETIFYLFTFASTSDHYTVPRFLMSTLYFQNTELIIPLIHKAHFVDSLLSTLKKSLHDDNLGINDITGESECEVVVSDITEIFSWIINCLVASPQHKHFMVGTSVYKETYLPFAYNVRK